MLSRGARSVNGSRAGWRAGPQGGGWASCSNDSDLAFGWMVMLGAVLMLTAWLLIAGYIASQPRRGCQLGSDLRWHRAPR